MALQQGHTFYKEFMDNVVGLNHAGVDESDRRVQFLFRNHDMIPKNNRELILSLTRSYPMYTASLHIPCVRYAALKHITFWC